MHLQMQPVKESGEFEGVSVLTQVAHRCSALLDRLE